MDVDRKKKEAEDAEIKLKEATAAADKKRKEQHAAAEKAKTEEEAKKRELPEEVIVEEEEIEEEEEVEEEEESVASPEKMVPTLKLEDLKSKVKEAVKKMVAVDTNKYTANQADGQQMVLKSMFDHPELEVRERLPKIRQDMQLAQEGLLKNEFENLKIVPPTVLDNKS